MQYSNSLKVFIVLLIGVFCAIQCDVPKKEKSKGKLPASGLNQENLPQNPEISSINREKFPVDSILGVWTVDPNGPHADFEINKKYYFLVDFEGNANVVYTIKSDTISVYLKDNISKGIILKARSDSLQIAWDNQDLTTYVRWKK